ncbi:LOW QUALITY PROTEIN: hypothetical protein BU14_1341s0003 [Porphyra umbilicalis]|uniref:Uncharacterized protein n=1 Tax=Porphyra umbilicalis TaxID=2786 RepID=A0A1X6NLZ4_PORUM|nr:LOW QUALITY PROTEIN: hypothetical protein BU14_1341s0003 [Porphyra umbilicalis]|eukprot:OSX69615.1 LOW QUALITY PROTEIN: hypothetical protein BU14_1341s0003 [Porphyra umbilicalis]
MAYTHTDGSSTATISGAPAPHTTATRTERRGPFQHPSPPSYTIAPSAASHRTNVPREAIRRRPSYWAARSKTHNSNSYWDFLRRTHVPRRARYTPSGPNGCAAVPTAAAPAARVAAGVPAAAPAAAAAVATAPSPSPPPPPPDDAAPGLTAAAAAVSARSASSRAVRAADDSDRASVAHRSAADVAAADGGGSGERRVSAPTSSRSDARPPVALDTHVDAAPATAVARCKTATGMAPLPAPAAHRWAGGGGGDAVCRVGRRGGRRVVDGHVCCRRVCRVGSVDAHVCCCRNCHVGSVAVGRRRRVGGGGRRFVGAAKHPRIVIVPVVHVGVHVGHVCVERHVLVLQLGLVRTRLAKRLVHILIVEKRACLFPPVWWRRGRARVGRPRRIRRRPHRLLPRGCLVDALGGGGHPPLGGRYGQPRLDQRRPVDRRPLRGGNDEARPVGEARLHARRRRVGRRRRRRRRRPTRVPTYARRLVRAVTTVAHAVADGGGKEQLAPLGRHRPRGAVVGASVAARRRRRHGGTPKRAVGGDARARGGAGLVRPIRTVTVVVVEGGRRHGCGRRVGGRAIRHAPQGGARRRGGSRDGGAPRRRNADQRPGQVGDVRRRSVRGGRRRGADGEEEGERGGSSRDGGNRPSPSRRRHGEGTRSKQ